MLDRLLQRPFSGEKEEISFCESTTLDSVSSNTTATSEISAQLVSEADNTSITMPNLGQMASLAILGGDLVDLNHA
jgi:hypothetical protein